MDQTVLEKVKKYADVVRRDMPVKMVILYGSYAKESEKASSDIDVAVVMDKGNIENDYLEKSARLFRLVWGIDTRIEPVLLSSTDDKSGFLSSILEYGKIIYQ